MSCVALDESLPPGTLADVSGYGEFASKVWQHAQGERLPIQGAIEVSRRCSLNCQHCYNNLPMGDSAARAREMSTDDYRRLLDQLVEAGCLWLLFTGGEVFARRDFLEIYTHAKRRGLIVSIFTNGTLITERIADHLAEYRPFAVEITLYGATAATYERLTQVPGSFERCMKGIELIHQRGLPLSLKSVATNINEHELQAMEALAKKYTLRAFKFDGMINGRVDEQEGPAETRLDASQLAKMDAEDPRRVEAWRDLMNRPQSTQSDSAEQAARREHLYHCGAGINSFAIDPYGQMSLCVLSESHKYDVRRGSFAEGWSQFLKAERAKKRVRATKCQQCGLRSLCSSCPAVAELEGLAADEPVDFFCRVAHLRAYSMDIHVPEHGDCEYCAGGKSYQALRQQATQAVVDGARVPAPPEEEAKDWVQERTDRSSSGP
jgi:radical SAM protein with 4Fe4S-binding SPASM domain